MFSYIRSCACEGHRPSHLNHTYYHQRPAITAQLLRDRTVTRFLVAPDGFGKTAAALEYADVVFGFEHVFWLRCSSPCFLRDLDAGVIASQIAEEDSEARLVVFESLPRFDNDRQELASQLFDTLLSDNREVIVTCVPSADAYQNRQMDRVGLFTRQLLLSDEELNLEDEGVEPVQAYVLDDRISSLHWGCDGGKQLLEGLRHEELPADVMLGALTILSLGQGTLADLEYILSDRWAARIWESLAPHYLYCGIPDDEESFKAVTISVELLASTFGRSFSTLVKSYPDCDRDLLVHTLAERLFSRGESKRANEVMRAFGSLKGQRQWMGERGWALVSCGELCSLLSIHRHLEKSRHGKHPEGDLMAATALALLGDEPHALALSQRILTSKIVQERTRTQAWVIALRTCPDNERARVLSNAKAYLTTLHQGTHSISKASTPPDEPVRESDLFLLTTLIDCLNGDNPKEHWRDFVSFWQRNASSIDNSQLALGGLWMLQAALGKSSVTDPNAVQTPHSSAVQEDLFTCADTLVGAITDVLEQQIRLSHTLSVIEASVASALMNIQEQWPAYSSFRFSDELLKEVNKSLWALRQTRQEYRSHNALTTASPLGAFSSRSESMVKQSKSAQESVIPLTINLFGGLTIHQGASTLSGKGLTRHKSRQLLALLILQHGREIPRDRLAEMLWPESDRFCARKNLYSTWSSLKKLLTPDGVCPYLLRSATGFRVAKDLVESDVYEFEEFSRSLMFSSTALPNWKDIYHKIAEDYQEDLLPAETENPEIIAARVRYKTQLIDLLVHLGANLYRSGELQGALWFSREAIDRDPLREDAYITLMATQIQANQRAEALETFFKCRRHLAEGLGIDPSATIVDLYRSIIDEEADI